MCCSWRSHRAEPGRLSPSPSLPLPRLPSSVRGPGRQPRKCSQKELSSGDIQRDPAGERAGLAAKEGNVGKSRDSLQWMQAAPGGFLPAARSELRAGLRGRSQPEQGGCKGKGISTLSAWGTASSCDALFQLQGLYFPTKLIVTPQCPRLQGPNLRCPLGCRLAALWTHCPQANNPKMFWVERWHQGNMARQHGHRLGQSVLSAPCPPTALA